MRARSSGCHGHDDLDEDTSLRKQTTTTTIEIHDEEPDVNLQSSSSSLPSSRWSRLSSYVQSGEQLLEQAGGEKVGVAAKSHLHQKDAFQAIRENMEFSVWQCMLAIGIYMAVAVVAFSYTFADHWSLIDSMYFAVVCFTTLGYGDLVPSTPAGRIFTCIFVLPGVAFLGIALGVLGSNVIEAKEHAVDVASQVSKANVMSLFRKSTDTEQQPKGNQATTTTVHNQTPFAKKTTTTKTIRGFVGEFLPVALVLVAFSATVVWLDPSLDDDLNTVLYFALITSTTVGFGDVVPTSQAGRLAAVFFIPLAVGAMGHWLTSLASWIMDVRQRRMLHKHMTNMELTLQDLKRMDTNRDGRVSRLEFLEFMLITMGKVDHALIREIQEIFDVLDSDGTGQLDRDDLIGAARKKLQGAQIKLELADYKSRLLQLSDSNSRSDYGSTTDLESVA